MAIGALIVAAVLIPILNAIGKRGSKEIGRAKFKGRKTKKGKRKK